MTSISGARSTAEGRSGGKILKRRRTSVAKTPYKRPTANPHPPTQNPNWLTGLVLPATRKIATGAGLLISSIFTADTSSSSESSSSDADCFSEGDIDGGNGGDDMPYDVPAELNAYIMKYDDQLQQRIGSVLDEVSLNVKISDAQFRRISRTIKQNVISSAEDPQLAKGKNNTKQVIEQLLIRETYSRKECDRLISIISSRVVDLPTRIGVQDDIVNSWPETPDIRNKDEKKWLEEKKVGSSSKSELEWSTHGFNSGLISYGNGDNYGLGGSPVEMAKSYMQRRPPWSSPRHMMDLESTTPVPIMLFDQQTPTSSFIQKKDSLASGSWNIREEIRRVRSKATEDMLLHTTAKSDLSMFSLHAPNISFTQYSTLEYTGPICPNDSFRPPAKPIQDASLTSTQGPPPHPFPVDSALETPHLDGTKNEALLIVVPEIKQQDSKAMQIGEDGGAVCKSFHSVSEPFPLVDQARPSDGNACATKEVAEISRAPNAEINSLVSKNSSFCAGMADGENEKPNREGDDAKSSIGTVAGEETCELLSEASMEVPDVNMETCNNKDSITSPLQAEKEEVVVVVGTRTPRRTPAVVVQNRPARVTKKGNRSRGGK